MYRISVPYAQIDPRFLFEKRRGQHREFWPLVSTIDGTVYSGYSGHVYSGHSDIVATFPGTKSICSIILGLDIVAIRI